MSRVLSTAFAILLIVMAGSAEAGQQVKLRGGEHAGFARLVFDWRKPVGYSASIEQGRLVVRFDRPALFDTSILRRDLEDYIEQASVRQDEMAISFGLKRQFDLKHFTLGSKVVVDLLDRSGVMPQGSQPSKSGPSVRLRSGKHPTFDRLVFEWPRTVSYRIVGTAPAPAITFAEPGHLDLGRFRAERHPRIGDLTPEEAGSGLSILLQVPDGVVIRHYQDGGQVVVDVVDPSPIAVSETEVVPAADLASSAMDRRSESMLTESEPGLAVAEVDDGETVRATSNTGESRVEALNEARGEESYADSILDNLNPLVTSAGPTAEAPMESAASRPQVDPSSTSPSVATPTESERLGKAAMQAESGQSSDGPDPKDVVLDTKAPLALVPQDLAAEWQEALAQPPTEAPRAQAGPMPKLNLPEGLAAGGDPDAEGAPKNLIVEPEAPIMTGDEDNVGAVATDVVEVDEADADWMPIPGRNLRPEPPVALAFKWFKTTAFAAFRRGAHLWFVFDQPSDPSVADRIAEVLPGLGPIEWVEAPGATVLRIAAPLAIGPRMVREGTVWKVDLRARGARPERPLDYNVVREEAQLSVRIDAKAMGRPVQVVDPEYGDLLHIVPLLRAGDGVGEELMMAEFEAPITFQGVVIRSQSETVSVDLVKKGVRISTPGGLILSDTLRDKNDRRRRASPILGQRLFDLPAWRLAPDALSGNHRQVLLQIIERASGLELLQARLNLVRFYFAHGLALEAQTGIKLIEETGEDLGGDPEFFLMKAVSRFLVEDYEEARELLSAPILAQEFEALPWHAAIAAIAQDWDFAATAFRRSEALFDAYPRAVKTKLRLLAAESRIGIGDSEGADFYLEQIRRRQMSRTLRAQVDLLEAKRRLLEFRLSTARPMLRAVAKGPHAASRVRARLELVDLELAEESPDYEAIAVELDRLRFAWRGDAFEFAVQARLAELFLELGKYRKALDTLNLIALKSPDEIIARQADRRLREAFKDLFLGAPKDDLIPLTALSLYEEYRFLAPDGHEGNLIEEALTDRLIDVDLLGQAAALLEDEIQFELTGERQAMAGAKLADVRLQDGLPRRALDALDATKSPDATSEIQQKRLLLRARALAALDRAEEAYAMLETVGTEAASRLHVEILWAREEWGAVGAKIERLLPDEATAAEDLTDRHVEDLTQLAVAYTKAGNTAGLEALDQRFGSAMEQREENSAFTLLTEGLGRVEVRSVAEELADAERIETYLTELRSRN